MINVKFPPIGLRTLKSALVVFLCLLLLPNEPFFACLTGVICLQDTVANSVKMGINRGLGTLVGASYGLIFMHLCRNISYVTTNPYISKLLIYLLISIGIIIVIQSCNIIKKPGAINVACIAFLGVTTVHAMKDPYFYAINRTFETLCGIFIAILVNRFVNPPEDISKTNENKGSL